MIRKRSLAEEALGAIDSAVYSRKTQAPTWLTIQTQRCSTDGCYSGILRVLSSNVLARNSILLRWYRQHLSPFPPPHPQHRQNTLTS